MIPFYYILKFFESMDPYIGGPTSILSDASFSIEVVLRLFLSRYLY